MTDGPFKHTDLSSSWKKYGEILDTPTMSRTDCVEQAQKALMEELSPAAFRQLIKDIFKQMTRLEEQLFPRLTIESIINKHSPSQQGELFRKHAIAHIALKMPIKDAVNAALCSTFESGIAQARERLLVYCIQADDRRNSSELKTNHLETFERLAPSNFTDAILGQKNSPVAALSREEDGPPL